MNDIILGLLAVLIGAVFCLRGYVAMRLIIPMWGSLAGFVLGAGIVAGVGDDGFLRTAAAWIVGLAVALLFGALAYLYFEVSVALALGAVGFALGSGLMTALGVRWSWVVALVGIVVGLLLAAIAIVGDLPAMLLVLLTAFGGATAVIFGLMLVFGVLDVRDVEAPTVTETINDSWYWYVIYLIAGVTGTLTQLRMLGSAAGSARAQWQQSSSNA